MLANIRAGLPFRRRVQVTANGRPPARRDRLAPSVSVMRMAQVRVGDTKGNTPYYVVRQILSWDTG
jgi:hypothetical protein